MSIVQPIKDASGTPLDPQQDQIECAGVIFQNSTSSDLNVRIERASDGQMKFYDSVQSMGCTLTELLVGSSLPPPSTPPLEMKVGTLGNGSLKNLYFNHNFQNERGVAAPGLQVQVWRRSDNKVLTPGRSGDSLTEIKIIDGNTILLQFSTAPGPNAILVTVVG